MATGEATATGEAIITEEVMAAGETEVQSVQTTLDGRIVTSTQFRTVAGHLAARA